MDRLDKVRVYELAKELNTTSKRLMEKLAEINIEVKNHMSFLEEHELKALYQHIGVITHDEKKEDAEEKKAVPSHQSRSDIKKDIKSAPRIIRTTEIIIDSGNEAKETLRSGSGGAQQNNRDNVHNKKRDIVRVADENSGLRAGFIRDTGFDYSKDARLFSKNVRSKTDGKGAETAEQKQELKPGTKQEPKLDVKQEPKAELKEEARQDVKPEVKQEPKLEMRQETKAAQNDVEQEGKKQRELEAGQPAETAGLHEEESRKQAEVLKSAEAKTDRLSVQSHSNQKKERFHAGVQQDGRKHNEGAAKERPQANKMPYREQQQDSAHGAAQNAVHPGESAAAQNSAARDSKTAGKSGDRKTQNAYRPGPRPLEIPKAEMTDTHKEELLSQRSEVRREFQNKDADKDIKREQKKESPKGQAGAKNKKFKPQAFVFNQKKGVSEILSEDFILDEFYDDSDIKKPRKAPKPKKDAKDAKNKGEEEKHVPPKAVLTSITIPESLTVKELAEALKKTGTEVIKKLMSMGLMVSLNQEIDFDTAAIVADEFGVKAEKEVVVNEEDILFDDSEEEDEANLKPRPPVVVVMGHVDHGKTSLLDAIRKTNVIDTEAGGITQHIGAYTVKINNRNITFLDTPGHEAFTAMRARGAQVTDIAILVVAADDGVMPQTVEAINHAKAANVSIIVAINKIDKPGANPERVKQELTEYGLVVEEWGGDVIAVPISAKNGTNIDTLLEMVLLTADMLELKANPNRQAKGTVIEAKLDKNRGPIATVLVQRGTLRVGDAIITGTTFGHIRAMTDDKGKNIKEAGPSMPVEILGLPEVPEAGELFYVVTDEKVAKHLVEKRKNKLKEEQFKATSRVSLDDLFNQIQEGKVKELNIIVKADVQGSVEAVKQSLEKLSNDEVRVKIIHGGVGTITESDVTLAQVSNAIIIGFNVRPSANVLEAAKNANVDIRLYRVIYNAIEDIQAAMKGMLEPTFREVILGHTEVRQIFKVSGVGTIGGCYVTDGKIARNSDIRVIRDGVVIHEGKLASLKRFKDDVKEVLQGFECGLSIEKFNDIKEGDIVEAYVMEEVERQI